MKDTIKIRIDHYWDRDEMVCILARHWYHVWIEEKEAEQIYDHEKYFVCFERGKVSSPITK